MSSSRASSLPPQGNPFWSGRAQLEYEIQTTRPLGLPRAEMFSVPDWVGEESERGHQEPGDRQRSEDPQEVIQDRFKTPSSWETVSGGQSRTEGPIPDGSSGGQELQPPKPRLGMRSQGRMPLENLGTRQGREVSASGRMLCLISKSLREKWKGRWSSICWSRIDPCRSR